MTLTISSQMNAVELLDRIRTLSYDLTVFNMPLYHVTPHDSNDQVVRNYVNGAHHWFELCFDALQDLVDDKIIILPQSSAQSKKFERDFALSVADLIRHLEKLSPWHDLFDHNRVRSAFDNIVDGLRHWFSDYSQHNKDLNMLNRFRSALNCAITVQDILK